MPLESLNVQALLDVLQGRRVAVLTGAGCSTESGIPDYRGPETRRRARNPIRFKEFVQRADGRRRYWARAFVGWEKFRGKQPNPAHRALARMEREGHLTGLITQNVDRLHHAAGSEHVIELHGALADVRCLACGQRETRPALQKRLDALNPGWRSLRAEMAPDGDAELPPDLVDRFVVASCESCGGPLKPDVVFFGEGVPRERVERAYAICDAADALLVVGSSLAVFSGYRFVKRAAERSQPIAIVNLGESRGDALADVVVQAKAGEILPAVAASL